MKQKNPLDNSRMLDIWIWSNKPEISATAKFIFTRLQNEQKPRLKEFKLPRLKNHIKVILTDLYVVHKEDPKKYLAFSRSDADYVPGKRFKKIFLNPKYVAFLTDFLAKEGFIEFHKGYHFEGNGRLSRMKATPKLLRHFRKNRVPGQGVVLSRKPGIILKDEKKRVISFDSDTLEVKTMLRNVWKINKYLKEYEITLDVDKIPAKLREFMPEISDKNSKYIRIFNNSDFQQGGRWYCHWIQNIPSEMRRYILINGKETVELDYSTLHPTILYALAGEPPPQRDLYDLVGISNEHRGIIKKAFNIAINSETMNQAISAINYERKEIEREKGIISPKAKEILLYIDVTHPVLSDYMCTGYGVRLQRIDSDLAEQIMLQLLSEGICVLSVHDSFLVATEFRDKLYNSMRNHFYNRFNFFPKIK